MGDEVWVLGGAGRTGRAISTALGERGIAPVPVVRDRTRLERAGLPPDARVVEATGIDAMVDAIARDHPAVVVNTVGPFQRTAAPLADAAIAAGASYVDLANDLLTVSMLLGRAEQAAAAGGTIVTGAGFGVTATESVVAHLMIGRPPAARVRVDMIPSLSSEEGTLGAALAETIVTGIPGVSGGSRFGSRRIAGGRLASASVGSDPMGLTTPDGDPVVTGGMPLGELLAAAAASGAPAALAASSEAPTGPFARALAPAAFRLLHIAPLRRIAARRLAAIRTTARPMPRAHSWGHARIEWDDGSAREGWLRLGDGNLVTAAVAAEVAARLRSGRGRPGAFTPAALFGPGLAEAVGGEYLDA